MLDQFSYKVSDLIDDVRGKFGDSGSVQISDQQMIQWLNLAAHELATQTSWLQNTAQTTLISGQTAYQMADVFADVQVRSISQVYVDGKFVPILPWSDYSKRAATSDLPDVDGSTAPYMAALYGDTINIFPAPGSSVANGLVVYFDAFPAKVTTLTDPCPVPDRLFQAADDMVFAQALELDENFDASKLKLGHSQDRVKMQFAREAENPDDFYAAMNDTTYQDYGV